MSKMHTIRLNAADADDPHARFVRLALRNPKVVGVLRGLAALGVNDGWLVSGALVQSVWNALCARPCDNGIVDYDVVYFDPNLSWEAEDRVNQRALTVFSALGVNVDVRNQARVHVWFKDEKNRTVRPLKNTCGALWRYPSHTTAIALAMDDEQTFRLCAPFGVQRALDMRVTPNRRRNQPQAYARKAARWKAVWPTLQVDQP